MPNSQKDFLTQLSASEMKKLLAARERIDVLETEKAKLSQALDKIENELAGLMSGLGASPKKPGKKPGRKKAAKKKAAAKKTTRKKAATKKTAAKKKTSKAAAKKVTRKVAKKKTTTKKVVRKKAGRPAGKKAAASGGRVKLEDVVVAVLKDNGGTMSFKDLIATIEKGKLFKSKSKNFDNVLRRTLSTTDKVKRAGRGVYTLG